MSAFSLFDHYASSGNSGSRVSRYELMRQSVCHLIDSTIRQLVDIKTQDHQFTQTLGDEEFDESVAAIFRDMYEGWALSADQVLRRVDQYERLSGLRVSEADPLRDSFGRVKAMLSVSLVDIREGLDQVRDGKTMSPEEVRRALHLGSRQ